MSSGAYLQASAPGPHRLRSQPSPVERVKRSEIGPKLWNREAADAFLRFRPPDSPNFTPIETAFPKLKVLTRAKAERTVEALWKAVAALVPFFLPTECTI